MGRVSKKERCREWLRLGRFNYDEIAKIVGCHVQTVYEVEQDMNGEANGEGPARLQRQIDELRERILTLEGRLSHAGL